jgi:hypothetical protein
MATSKSEMIESLKQELSDTCFRGFVRAATYPTYGTDDGSIRQERLQSHLLDLEIVKLLKNAIEALEKET